MNFKAIVMVAALAVVLVGLAVLWWVDRQDEDARRDRLERLVQEDRRRKEKEEAETRRQREKKEAETRRRTEELLAVVRPLLPRCRATPGPRDVRVRGKVWVWDETTRSASGANQKLPADRRGEPGDADLTVFVITSSIKVQVAAYHSVFGGKESPGYRRDLEVCGRCGYEAATRQGHGQGLRPAQAGGAAARLGV